MGITRSKFHKRRATGGKVLKWRKKRKYELGRPAALTKIGQKRTHVVRTRGGNRKYRAMRLETGVFSWSTEGQARKTRIISVVFAPANNEFVRTNTLVKSSVVLVDATPFRQWYEAHYGAPLAQRKGAKDTKGAEAEVVKRSKHLLRRLAARRAVDKVVPPDPHFMEQFANGRLMAFVSSRPGQSGRADGYLLEGKELDFYVRKLQKRKEKGQHGAHTHKGAA